MPVYFHKKSIRNREEGAALGTPSFKEKSKIKLEVIAKVLWLGYNVIASDVDMFFSKNPQQNIWCGSEFDMAIINNGTRQDPQMNSGFMYIKANAVTVQFFRDLEVKARGKIESDMDVFDVNYNSSSPSGPKIYTFPVMTFCSAHIDNTDNCTVYHSNLGLGLYPKRSRLKDLNKWAYGTPEAKAFACPII
jgi:hypothetical protein